MNKLPQSFLSIFSEPWEGGDHDNDDDDHFNDDDVDNVNVDSQDDHEINDIYLNIDLKIRPIRFLKKHQQWHRQ